MKRYTKKDINELSNKKNFSVEGSEVWYKRVKSLMNYYEEYLIVESSVKGTNLPTIIVEDWQTQEYELDNLNYDGIKENYWIRHEFSNVVIYLSHAAKVKDLNLNEESNLKYIHSIYKEWKLHKLHRLVDND